MNKQILNTKVQDFINSNLKSDITKLILKGSPFAEVSIQELAEQIEAKNKCEKKLPTWYKTENIYFPKKINIEQTSSEITAKFKAELVLGNTLIDLTGGFGIDCYYFSKRVKKVIHCEMNSNLSTIVNHNYKQLQVNNIETFEGNGFNVLEQQKKVDWVYIDPSRRNDVKGKVFLLNDCFPNVPKNLDLIFTKTENILIKVSPILDISSATNELKFVKKVYVVSVNNEVKELLFVLEKNYEGNITIETINFNKYKLQSFSFKINDLTKEDYCQPLNYLYEPNSAILKAGGFKYIQNTYNVFKIHKHSHLYTTENLLENFPGRIFKIVKIVNYNKKELKKILPTNKANITTRNFPETVSQIRKKTGIKDGGDVYIFFTTNKDNKPITIICEKSKNQQTVNKH